MLTAAPLRAPEEQLKLLALHLRADRVGLLIVTSPDAETERALVEEVRLRIKDEVAVEEVTFAPEPVECLSLSYHLSTLPSSSGKAAAFVFGLDDLPPDTRTTAINAMNWGRERRRWSGYTIVLWVRPGTPGDLGNRAPDFFSWRSDVFEFDIPTDPAARQQMLARLRLFAPAVLDELRQRYCDYVVRTYQWLDFRGLLQLRNVVRLPLDEVFVPLQATTTVDYPLPSDFPPTFESTTPDDWRRYERQRIERRVALNDAVRQHRHLVVLGDPGSGKSTLLRFLALAFAQGRQQVQERLGISEDRLPILVPLSAFAEARQTQPDLPLAAFLPRYFLEQGLPDFSPLFDDALSSGRALVLLDGLDEMLTADDRTAVARAIVEFTNTYSTSRVVVTSRIAGYAPGTLPASFATFTVASLDDDTIKQFAKQWSLAFEAVGLPSHTELSPEARRRAQLRADSLAAAATSPPGVRRLATNPLLLTLLALIHYQGTRLPNRRTDLYRLCVEALAETWNLARSLSGRPIDLRLGERRLDEELVVHILAPVAYWMHENKPTGLISREELEARVAEQFAADGSSEDPAALARDFVNLAREQMGLLVERAPDEFSFLHLSIQEYLAARFLSERKDAFDRLKPRLHQPRWREVVLLTAGCLRGDYAAEFVENILNAHVDFHTLPQLTSALRPPLSLSIQQGGALVLQRGRQQRTEVRKTLLGISDLLLAAHCVGDGVTLPPSLLQQIRETLFEFWLHPPFCSLRYDIKDIFTYLKGSDIGRDVLKLLLTIAQSQDEDMFRRHYAVWALEQLAQGEPEILNTLFNLVQDRKEGVVIHYAAASALGRVAQGEPEILNTLLNLVQDKGRNWKVRMNATLALGRAGQGRPEVIQTLFALAQDKNEDELVRKEAMKAFGQAGQERPEVLQTLLALVQNRDEDELLRRDTAWILGEAGQGNSQVIDILLRIIQDKGENKWARKGAATALAQAGQGRPEVIRTLFTPVQDKNEDCEVREDAVSALGQAERESVEVRTTLLHIVQDENEDKDVRRSATAALGQVGQGDTEVARTLLYATGDPHLYNEALGALWNLLAQGA